MKRIVLCFPVTDSQVEQIQQSTSTYQVINAGQDRVADELPDAEIFCGHAKVPVPWAEVVEAGNLKWIQSSAAGLDHCLTPEVTASDIQVTSASGLFADQVAEQTFALLFGLTRRIPRFIKAASRKEFVRRPTDDFHGKTVGIIGFGGNGRRIARLLEPFGNRILATDVFPVDCPDYVEQLLPADKIDEVLAQSDVIILCVPLLDSTRHLIDQPQLGILKKNATVINVARGKVINESALVEWLKNNPEATAGLDVTYEEPLPETSELWSLDNVLISPHVGAQSAKRVPDTVDFFCENLRRFASNLPLMNEVDKTLGFPRPTAE